ncbi:hypothetical protein CNR34_00127 [Pseudomonas phage nickie]|uniref:Uncharacterized protein n=1 Tax=Pseudomonas phage nickie TaxID=2048977 RepID=A0A2H4P7P5_9CAUD|nr:hypothetical protein FDJ16_gp038 [Pseudomonas phage nickie]ATW58060.1 hypothetical protein CNR34_00127 [Pseudomonas phage nickie]
MSKFNPYALNKPCENCPFLKDESKAIRLQRGRRDGIIEDLLDGSVTGFSCHKTVHSKTGGEWDEDGDGSYIPSGRELECAGAIAVLEKLNRPTQLMRIMERMGAYDRNKYIPLFDLVIDYDPT